MSDSNKVTVYLCSNYDTTTIAQIKNVEFLPKVGEYITLNTAGIYMKDFKHWYDRFISEVGEDNIDKVQVISVRHIFSNHNQVIRVYIGKSQWRKS